MFNTFENYLNFNQEKDRTNQLQALTKIQLKHKEKISKLRNNLLIVAEPFCPDCVIIVAMLEKMAQINPNIQLNFINRIERDNLNFTQTSKIPAIYDLDEQGQNLIFNEFPKFLKEIKTESFAELRVKLHQHQLNDALETEIIELLTKSR